MKELSLEERVAAYNRGVAELAAALNMPHPVLMPQLVRADQVRGNHYNPNRVAPPEQKLLEHSIRRDGVTMAVVVAPDPDPEGEGKFVVVDGFHRTQTIQRDPEILESLCGYIPVVVLDRDLPNLMASTVRHNLARGTHQVDLSAKLVAALTKHHWDDARIGQELGMDPEEVLRLKQVTGLAEIFADKDFSEAWEVPLSDGS
jgi:ParB-like chromosome segregation protein Spo0J